MKCTQLHWNNYFLITNTHKIASMSSSYSTVLWETLFVYIVFHCISQGWEYRSSGGWLRMRRGWGMSLKSWRSQCANKGIGKWFSLFYSKKEIKSVNFLLDSAAKTLKLLLKRKCNWKFSIFKKEFQISFLQWKVERVPL